MKEKRIEFVTKQSCFLFSLLKKAQKTSIKSMKF